VKRIEFVVRGESPRTKSFWRQGHKKNLSGEAAVFASAVVGVKINPEGIGLLV
jgi:hypothetical protein